MATEGLTGPSEARAVIDNAYLDNAANVGKVIDVVNLTPPEAFMRIKRGRKLPKAGRNGTFDPRGISINFESDGAGGLDTDATLALVDNQEKNEPFFFPDRFAIGVVHPVRIRKIRVGPNTTARGIKIHQ